MNQIFHTNYSRFAQPVFNQLIASNRNALAVNLSKSTFVNQFSNRFEVRITPCNVRLTNPQHVDGGFVQLYEHTIVDLAKAEQLEDFAHFGGNFVDTKNNKKITVRKLFKQQSLKNFLSCRDIIETVIKFYKLTL